MSPDEIRTLLHKQPFVPLRLHMSNGMTLDIRHPEMAIVGGEHMAIGVTPDGANEPLINIVSLININVIEPIQHKHGAKN